MLLEAAADAGNPIAQYELACRLRAEVKVLEPRICCSHLRFSFTHSATNVRMITDLVWISSDGIKIMKTASCFGVKDFVDPALFVYRHAMLIDVAARVIPG